jgi:hypothetical protein
MKTRRFIAAAATSVVALLTLTGCISVEMKITVNSDDTANGSVAMSFDKTVIGPLLAMSGEDVTNICAFLETQMDSQAADTETTEVKWSETSDACVMTSSSKTPIAFDENGLKQEIEGTEGMQIVKSGTSATISFPADGFADGLDQMGSQAGGLDQILSAFTLQVSFPGAVANASHNGKISGNTVTWDLASLMAAADAEGDMTATGSLVSTGGGNLWMIIGIAVLLALVAAGVIFFLMRRNKGAAATPGAAAPMPPAPEAPSATE